MNNYFQAIQTALFYKKNTFEMFKSNFNMFLDLSQGLVVKIKTKAYEKLTTEVWSQIFARVASFGCRKF